MEHKQEVRGDVYRYDTSDDDNFTQAAIFWNQVLGPDERDHLVSNLVGHLKKAKVFIQERMVEQCNKVSPDLGDMVSRALKA